MTVKNNKASYSFESMKQQMKELASKDQGKLFVIERSENEFAVKGEKSKKAIRLFTNKRMAFKFARQQVNTKKFKNAFYLDPRDGSIINLNDPSK